MIQLNKVERKKQSLRFKEKIRKFLLKRDRGNLISQRTAQIFSNFLKEVQLEVPCDFVRFGAIIQLNAPNMPRINSSENQSLVVSIAMDGIIVNQMQSVNSSCILSLAPSIRSCVRNSFIITRYVLETPQQFVTSSVIDAIYCCN